MQAMSFPNSSVEALTSGLSSGNVPEKIYHLKPIGSFQYFYKHFYHILFRDLWLLVKLVTLASVQVPCSCAQILV